MKYCVDPFRDRVFHRFSYLVTFLTSKSDAEKETGQTNRSQLDTKTNDYTEEEEEEDGEFQLDEGIFGDHLCVS